MPFRDFLFGTEGDMVGRGLILSAILVAAIAIPVTATDTPGGQVRVAVNWQVPNFFAGLIPLFGQSAGDIHGRDEVVYRKERW